MVDAIQPLIDELARNRGSEKDEPLVAVVNDAIAALQEIQAAIATGGLGFLPLAGGTMLGPIGLPQGSAAAPALAFGTSGGFFFDPINSGPAIAAGGNEIAFFSALGAAISRTGAGVTFSVLGEGTTIIISTRTTNDVNGSQVNGRKARGTMAAPLAVIQNDIVTQHVYSAWDGVATYQIAGSTRFTIIEPVPGPTAMGGRWTLFATPLGSISSNTEVARLEAGTGLSMFGANPVIDNNRLLRNRVFTVATLPTFIEGAQASVSDATLTMITGLGLAPIGGGANHVPVTADNIGWKIL